MTAPVFVVYQLGLLFLSVQNGADWITGSLLRVVEWNRAVYVGLVVLAGLAMAAVAKRAVRRPHEDLRRILLESMVLALGLVFTVGLVGRALAPSLLASVQVPMRAGAASVSLFAAIVLSAGAGFHEELLFRVVAFEGGTRVLAATGRSKERATLVCALVSSVLFALAHHIGTFGEPLALVPLAMRFISGLYLCAIMRLRGFATAVYTHTLYDVIVLTLLS